MKTYKVCVQYMMTDTIEIQASDLDEAKELALEDYDCSSPTAEYLEDSLEVADEATEEANAENDNSKEED